MPTSRKLLLFIPTIVLLAVLVGAAYVFVIRPVRRGRAAGRPAVTITATPLPAATPVGLVLGQGGS